MTLVVTTLMLLLSIWFMVKDVRRGKRISRSQSSLVLTRCVTGYGPFLLTIFSAPLLIANPVVNLMQDYRYFEGFEPMVSGRSGVQC